MMLTGSTLKDNFQIILLRRCYRPVEPKNFPQRCSGQKVKDVAVVASKN